MISALKTARKETTVYPPLVAERLEIQELESAAFTDPGTRRDLNQDVVFHQTGQIASAGAVGLFLVCDGIGGNRGGEIASRIAVDTITGALAPLFCASGQWARPSALALSHQIAQAVTRANEEIRQYAQKHADMTPRLGTTVTLALIYEDLVHIAHVGDGRVYLRRDGQVTQLTQDHSVAALLAKEGVIREDEIAQHPNSNVILRALGTQEEVEVDIFDWKLQPGDKLLLCSDGLWKSMGNPAELASWLDKPRTAAALCQQLVAEAKTRDGSDNISAVVVDLK